MPRNAAGVYTLPSGNPVITGTTIESGWANTTMPDLGGEVTNSLDRSGRGSMLAPLKLTDGSQALPGMTFSAEPSSGWFRAGAGDLRLSVLNTLVMTARATGISWALALGTALLPSLAFSGDPNTGIYSPGADQFAVSTGGVLRFSIGSNGAAALTSTGGTGLLLTHASGQAGFRTTDGTVITRLATAGGTTAFFGTESAHTLSLIAGNSTRMSVTSAGVWQVQAPDSGNSFNVAQIDGQHAVLTSQALSGGTVSWRIENSSNTASARAQLQLVVGGATAADPIITWTVTGATSYGLGIDNSDTDSFVLARSTALGTTNALRLSNAGNFDLIAPASSHTLTVGQLAGAIAIVTSESLSGNEAFWRLENTNNGGVAGTGARLQILTGGASGGDAMLQLGVSGGSSYTIGVDNSDSDSLVFALGTALGTTNRLILTSDGRLYGTALHNNAGAVTGTANQYIASGTYTPVGTAVLNVATITPALSHWLRVGNVVQVGFSGTVDPTATGAVQFDLSLPIASDFTAVGNATGLIDTGAGAAVAVVAASIANNRFTVNYVAASLALTDWYGSATYVIL